MPSFRLGSGHRHARRTSRPRTNRSETPPYDRPIVIAGATPPAEIGSPHERLNPRPFWVL
jgi:hypothetical protein